MNVAVTAYSACNGLGQTTGQVLEKLRSGTHGLRPCPMTLPFEMACGVVPDPLPTLADDLGLPPVRHLGIGALAYQGIAEAVAEAVDRWGPTRVGAVLGTSTGGIAHTEEAYFHWRETGALPDGYSLDAHSFHTIGRSLRAVGGWSGPTYVVSTACSSSAKVFASARRLLRSGCCDAVLVGGIDSLALTTLRGFHSLSAASSGHCRPFSAERDGMNVGEGAALLLLERDRPSHVQLVGVGESNDAFHMSAPDPEGRGAIAAMQAALDDAGARPGDVDYVNAHGTGTKRNDIAEALAIGHVLGEQVPVVSTKSYTGHMLGAGGATEAVFAVAAIEQEWVPGNLRLDPVDPEIHLHLPREGQARPVRTVLSNSFAFGGSNACLAFRRSAS